MTSPNLSVELVKELSRNKTSLRFTIMRRSYWEGEGGEGHLPQFTNGMRARGNNGELSGSEREGITKNGIIYIYYNYIN